jgi:antirestriction protein ArdC
MDRFTTAEEYYSVYFHELAHSTGHESRLDRKLTEERTKEKYGQEELVAEFAAAFLCHECGIERATIDNSAAYLDGWKKAIKGDVKMLVMAASQAQKAVDCILNRSLVVA